MAITWLETDVSYSSSPKWLRCVGYEETGRNSTSVTYKIYLKLRINGSTSSSSYGYGINWRVDGGSWLTVKNASPKWYGGEGYREFSTTITKSVGTGGGSTTFSVQVDGLGGSSADYTKSYTANYSTFNTAPYWSGQWFGVKENNSNGYTVADHNSSTGWNFKAREDVANYYLFWGGAVDPNNNIKHYEVYCSINEGAYSKIYTGSNTYYTHNVGGGSGTQGTKFRYFVRAVDTYGLTSSDLYVNQFQKNAITGATPSVSNNINYDTTELAVNWSGASNTNGNTSFTYRVTSPHITVYNIGKLTSSGGKIKILKSGTSTDPYISFDELKNMTGNYGHNTYIDLHLYTRNAYGTEVSKSVRVYVDLRTNPQAPTTITIGGHTKTSLGNYLIPSKARPTVSWSGAYDKLGGSLTYDVYYKLGSGAETLISAGTNTTITLPIDAVYSSTTVGIRVVAQSGYNYTAGASNNTETLHYYNPPTVYFTNPNRTITEFTVDINSKINTSLPKAGFTSQSYTGNGVTKTFTGVKYTASLSGLEADSTFNFTATVTDNTGLSSAQSSVYKVVPAIPKLSVREKGVGVNCVNNTSQALAVEGGANLKGDITVNNLDIKTNQRLGTQALWIGGDANKYYPVLIRSTTDYGFATNYISIGRYYSWEAPDSWNTPTHKGGLTFSFTYTGESGWGGNSRHIIVNEFHETYCKMVAGMRLSVNGLIVWLRGGGASYHLNSNYGSLLVVECFYEPYTASDGQVYSARDYNATVVKNEIEKRFAVREGGSGSAKLYAQYVELDDSLFVGSGSDTMSAVRTPKEILFTSGGSKNVMGANVFYDGANDVHYNKNAGASQIVLDGSNYPKYRWSSWGEASYGIAQWSSYYHLLTDYEGQQVLMGRWWVGDGINWNDVVNTGIYAVNHQGTGYNKPIGTYMYGCLLVCQCQGVVTQIYFPHNAGYVPQYRVRWSSGNWTNWVKWSATSTFSLQGVNEELISDMTSTLEGEEELEGDNLETLKENNKLKHIINKLDSRIKELEKQLEDKKNEKEGE